MTTTFDATHARSLVRGTTFTAIALVLATAACGKSSNDGAAAAAVAKAVSAAPLPSPVIIQPRFGTVRLTGGEHPLARPTFDRGRLDPARRIGNLSVYFTLSNEQKKDRDALFAAQLDRGSPLYHKWLTPETYRARFGVDPDVLARVSTWLEQQGFQVKETSALGTRIAFSATVEQLEKGFQTELHRYVLGTEEHYAMATAPAIPEELSRYVLSVHNTHNFYPKPASRRAAARAVQHPMPLSPRFDCPTCNQGSPADVLGPADWASYYGVTQLYTADSAGKAVDGKGVTIGIVGGVPVAQTDIDAFRTTFKLPQTKVNQILMPNTGPAPTEGMGAGFEAILDLEWAGGIATEADIVFVYPGSDDTQGGSPNVDDAATYIIEHNLSSVLSESWGGPEAGTPAADADAMEVNGTAANLMGITYMASAGDDGAADAVGYITYGMGIAGLYVDLPGALPGVTCVGGTQFPDPTWSASGALTDAGIEQIWNEGNNPYLLYGGMPDIGAGGGGTSLLFPRPTWQTVDDCTRVGSLPQAVPGAMRQVPDIAVSAAGSTPGYYVECTIGGSGMNEDCSATGGSPQAFATGGTSAAAPSFSGVVAILNQAVGERVGNINPMLYQLLKQPPAAAPFHDVTSGSNEIVCGPNGVGDAGGTPSSGVWPDAGCADSGLYGYPAEPGYDCASGVGSVNAYNLVQAWLGATKTDTAIVPNPTTSTEGQSVQLTATIHVDGTQPVALTGNVTFSFQSYTASGANDLSWELGTVAIANGTQTDGTAVLSTPVPPGLVKPNQVVDVFAVYGGDANHLASSSTKVPVTFTGVDFAVVPATSSMSPHGSESLSTTGGIPPVQWYIQYDSTQVQYTYYAQGAYLEQTDAGLTTLTAGGAAGYVQFYAIDSQGAEAIGLANVGAATSPPWWLVDAGVDSGTDAATTDSGASDAGVHDAAPDTTTPVDSAVNPGNDASTGNDAATAKDASTPKDSAAPPAKDASSSKTTDAAKKTDSGEETEAGGGGGCQVAMGYGSQGRVPFGAFGLMLGLGLVARRRRAS